MAGKLQARVPRGMRDILPEKMIRRQYVMDVVRDVFETFGFEPLQTPVMELKETLMGKHGEEAEKLFYFAQHGRGGEELALRYDLTVPLARVAAMHRDLRKPFKRYQIAPLFRAERPQRGRYREFYQCDVDIVGCEGMLADAEIINVVYAVLRRLGFSAYRIQINNRKILVGIGQYAGVPDELLGGLYRPIDKLGKIGIKGVRAEMSENGIPDEVITKMIDLLSVEGSDAELLDDLGVRLADYPLAVEGVAELRELVGYLRALGIPDANYEIDFSMVRGLDYYTGPIFETVVDEPKIGSITGGGRYDKLIGLFAKESLPVTGTSLGLERLIDVMDELEMFPASIGATVTRVLVTQFDAGSVSSTLALASELRQAGLNTELFFEPTGLGKQLRYASRKGIPFVVIAGPDELEQGQVTLRDLARSEQLSVSRGSMVDTLQAWLAEIEA
jgi:histidyl-tRNA synthetase